MLDTFEVALKIYDRYELAIIGINTLGAMAKVIWVQFKRF